MTTSFDLHVQTRKNILGVIEGLSLEQINKIPTGFSGNIAWHIGHLVSSSQGLLYRLSGLEVKLDSSFIDLYKKGSVPTKPITQEEFDFIKKQLQSQPEVLKKDMDNAIFKNYTAYPTSYGNTIHSFSEALEFVNIHEGLHLGYIMALKRII